MANDGCFLGLKPIAEAIELKLRPLGLGRPCREGFWVEYGLPFPILCNLEGRDHQAREGDSWREGNVEDMRDDLPKRMWEFEMIQGPMERTSYNGKESGRSVQESATGFHQTSCDRKMLSCSHRQNQGKCSQNDYI